MVPLNLSSPIRPAVWSVSQQHRVLRPCVVLPFFVDTLLILQPQREGQQLSLKGKFDIVGDVRYHVQKLKTHCGFTWGNVPDYFLAGLSNFLESCPHHATC